MPHHRLVEARSVAVVVAVHLGRVVGMRELEQSAVRAPDQLQRPRRDPLLLGAGGRACEVLLTQGENLDQMRAAAHAAFVDLLWQLAQRSPNKLACRGRIHILDASTQQLVEWI